MPVDGATAVGRHLVEQCPPHDLVRERVALPVGVHPQQLLGHRRPERGPEQHRRQGERLAHHVEVQVAPHHRRIGHDPAGTLREMTEPPPDHVGQRLGKLLPRDQQLTGGIDRTAHSMENLLDQQRIARRRGGQPHHGLVVGLQPHPQASAGRAGRSPMRRCRPARPPRRPRPTRRPCGSPLPVRRSARPQAGR
jgi:hypothetical protein